MDEKESRNARVAARYDELMSKGKHGHYETLFRVVREEVEKLRTQLDQAINGNKAHYELGREQQAIQDAEALAACQAHKVELRELLDELRNIDGYSILSIEYANSLDERVDSALSRVTDTEALDAAIAKAVETKLARCVDICKEVAEGKLLLLKPEYEQGMKHGATRCAEIIEERRKNQ